MMHPNSSAVGDFVASPALRIDLLVNGVFPRQQAAATGSPLGHSNECGSRAAPLLQAARTANVARK
jgi:hypothetical protein